MSVFKESIDSLINLGRPNRAARCFWAALQLLVLYIEAVYLVGVHRGSLGGGSCVLPFLGFLAGLEELGRYLGKQRVAQYVLFLLVVAKFLHFLLILLQLGLQQIGRAAGDNFLVTYGLAADFLVYISGQRAVFAGKQSLGILWEGLIAAH